jgi:hypothetical protein
MRIAGLIPIVLVAALGWECQEAEVPAGERFGAELTLARPTPLAGVLAAPGRFAEQPVLLHGRLADVCQRKGCWTVLKAGDSQIRVRFADYGFFLPRDAVGAEAFVEGTVDVQTLSEAEARHYASESLHEDPAAVHGPRREVGFIASGVRLVRPN